MSETFDFSPEEVDHIRSTFKAWTATATQARERILTDNIVVMMPNLPDAKLLSAKQTLLEATRAGRMFDLGFLPNDAIKAQSKRAGPLWNRGFIQHPFQDPYVLFHQWEGGASVYLVMPLTAGADIIEYSCVSSLGMKLLHSQAYVRMAQKGDDEGRWQLQVLFPPISGEAEYRVLRPIIVSAIDPVMVAMLILNTRGIETEKIEVDAKLQRARIKSGKAPIPSHWRVRTQDYVTAIANRRRGREHQGGHHASPIPHLRRGHRRHLHERHGGGVVWIADTMVMLRDGKEFEVPHRAFYEVKR